MPNPLEAVLVVMDSAFHDIRGIALCGAHGAGLRDSDPPLLEMADAFEGSARRLNCPDREAAARHELHLLARYALGMKCGQPRMLDWMRSVFSAAALELQDGSTCSLDQ